MHTHTIPQFVRSDTRELYTSRDIDLHIDRSCGEGGDKVSERTGWNYSALKKEFHNNESMFSSERVGIYHHSLVSHDLEGACGKADSVGDFSVLPEDDITSNDCDASLLNLALDHDIWMDILLEEWGHNDLGHLEPSADQCAGDEFHGVKNDAIECEGADGNTDLHDNRWREYNESVDWGPDLGDGVGVQP